MIHQICKIRCVYKTPFRKSSHIYTFNSIYVQQQILLNASKAASGCVNTVKINSLIQSPSVQQCQHDHDINYIIT